MHVYQLDPDHSEKCDRCHGKGTVLCSVCNGRGRKADGYTCSTCHGDSAGRLCPKCSGSCSQQKYF